MFTICGSLGGSKVSIFLDCGHKLKKYIGVNKFIDI